MERGGGTRAGSRRAPRAKRSLPSRTAFALSLGITLCVVAWGYLVFAAIDFGSAVRDGEAGAWLFLALACAGAAACLFTGLLLGVRLAKAAGLTEPREPGPTRPPGGRRAAR